MGSPSALGSAADIPSEKFIPVIRRRHRSVKNVYKCGHSQSALSPRSLGDDDEYVASIHELHNLIGRARQRIILEYGTTFLSQVVKNFETAFRRYFKKENPDEIVCYALGRFSVPSSWSFSCRLQLILLLDLAQFFDVPVLIYDPAFSSLEKQYLTSLYCGFKIIDQNESARRTATLPSLFYMIHAENELYVNLYQSNQETGTMENVILFGNPIRHVFPEFREKFASVKDCKRKEDKCSVPRGIHEPDILFSGYKIHAVNVINADPNGLLHNAFSSDTVLQFLTNTDTETALS